MARRMQRDERERQIVAGAIAFFAEHGFSGQTRALASSLGITQPLLYAYFPSKQALIDRLYEEMFLERWNDDWPRMIGDQAVPLRTRLVSVYGEFAMRILSREWVRMFVHAGLDNQPYLARVLARIQATMLRPIAAELRRAHGYPMVPPSRLRPAEVEHVWNLHGSVFYFYLRLHVYGLQLTTPVPAMIDGVVDSLLAGAPAALARILGPPPVAARRHA